MMRGIVFKLLPLVMLAACATTPGIKVKTVEVPVVVTQKCVNAKDIPVRPKPLKEEGVYTQLEQALAVALAKISEWTRYGNKTETILKNCS